MQKTDITQKLFSKTTFPLWTPISSLILSALLSVTNPVHIVTNQPTATTDNAKNTFSAPSWKKKTTTSKVVVANPFFVSSLYALN